MIIPLDKTAILETFTTISHAYQEDISSITIFESTDSTNTQAKYAIQRNPTENHHGKIFLAESQTAGRGRLGKTFYSPNKTGIYASIIVDSQKITLPPHLITPAVAVAVTRMLQKQLNLSSEIKWVNDIFIDKKKVCGILTEGIFQAGKLQNIVIGIGLNISTDFEQNPDNLQNIATSLSSICSTKKFDRNILFAHLLSEIFIAINTPQEKIMQEYKEKSLVLNKTIQVIESQATYFAKVLDITPEGHLLIQRENDNSIKELLSGEISIKLNT